MWLSGSSRCRYQKVDSFKKRRSRRRDCFKEKSTYILTALAGAVSAVGFILTADDETVLIRNLALLLPMLAIAIVDSLIRKIPNSLLLVMIITQAAYIAYVCITSHTIYALVNAGIGFS